MANNNPEIVLDGDVSPFRQKLREAAADLKRFGDDGSNTFERMTGPLGALQSKFVALGALLAGGAVFKEAVQQAKEWTEQSVDMAAAMGISATAAGNLKAALADEGVDASTFMGAATKLATILKDDEGALNAVGLATRDAAGNLRPLNELTVDAIELTGKYKAGTDRAIAASELFGKGFQISGDLAKINSALIAENTERQQALAATVTNESVAAFEEYDAASKGADATLRAIWQTVGTVLMPVLATLGNWFVAIGPVAVTVIRGALGGLAATFHLLTTGVTVLWETLNALVVTFTEPIRAMASALYHIVQGDFVAAAEQLRNIPSTIGGAWGNAFDEMATKAQNTRDHIWNLFSGGTPVAAGEGGGKSANGLVTDKNKDKKDKPAADPSFMQYYDLALAEEKRLASEKDALREYTKAEELAYWQLLLDHADLAGKDRVSIEKKVADLTVAVRREEAKEKQALDTENASHAEALALLRVDAEVAAAEDSLAAGQINAQARAELEIQFEQRRLEIQRAALQERLQLAEQDPNSSPAERARLQHAIETLQMQHGTKLVGLQRKVAQEQGQIWGDLGNRMSSLWDKGIQALMNGTFRWRNAFKAVGAELVNWFATSVVGNFVKEWLASKAKQLAISLGFMQAEKTVQVAGSAATVATKTTEATAVAGANAVGAGTGAASAMASIPFVGPMLALAAMATVFAAVSAMGGKIKSASKGFDIPKGLNPMTQLHEEEMVLPAQFANVIRGLAGGEGQGSGGAVSPVNVNISAVDAKGVERLFMANRRSLVDAIRSAARDGKR